jgi:hypothetical protein
MNDRGAHVVVMPDLGAMVRRVIVMIMVVVVVLMIVVMPMIVMMVAAAAEQPDAGHVHGETETGDGNRRAKMDRHRVEEAHDGLVADQQRDHGQHDGAAEAGEIAELAGAEGEAGVMGVAAGEAISEGGQQQCTGMGAHMQPVGDQGDGPEQEAADDFCQHHAGAEGDHPPGTALGLIMVLAEEHMRVSAGRDGRRALAHRSPAHLR